MTLRARSWLARLLVAMAAAGGLAHLVTQPMSVPMRLASHNTVAPTPLYIPPTADWLATLNYHRAMAGLPSVTEESVWSEGDWLHARYMVMTGQGGHYEDPSNPWYTPEGDAAARVSNEGGGATERQSIENWMTAPFHGIGLLRPGLQRSGFGWYPNGASGAAAIDVWRGYSHVNLGEPVVWPGDGTTVPLRGFYGGEFPNPLTSCAGYSSPAGMPLYVQLPETPNVTSYSVETNGNAVPTCEFDSTNYVNPNPSDQDLGRNVLATTNGVILMPRDPLTPGNTYDVTVVSGSRTVEWSFTVAGARETWVSLNANPSPSEPDANVTLTAQVLQGLQGGTSPTGTVTFYDGAAAIGTATLSNSPTFGTAQISVPLDAGSHLLTARYNGDTNYDAKTSPELWQIVGDLHPQMFGLGWDHPSNDPAGVQMASGNLVTGQRDAEIPGGPLEVALDRVYNSLDTLSGPLGAGWTHRYDEQLIIHNATKIDLRAGTGQRLRFHFVHNRWVAEPGGRWKLETITGGFKATGPDQEVHQFDGAGRLVAVEHPAGQTLTLTYASGKLQSVSDGVRTITFTYDGAGLLTTVGLPAGRQITYTYTDGKLTTVTRPGSVISRYTYGTDGRLADIKDAAYTTLASATYAADGRAATLSVTGAGTRTFTWNPATREATSTDTLSRTWRYRFQAGLHTEITPPTAGPVSFEWDTDRNLTAVTDATGLIKRTTDADGNVLSEERWSAPDANGDRQKVSSISHTYDTDGRLLTTTDGASGTTEFDYDTDGNLSRVEDPLGNTTSYGYDTDGNLTSVTDPLDKTTSYTYDSAGRRTSVTDPLNKTTSFVYDSYGNITSSTDARGKTTTYSYDAADRLTTVVDPLDRTTSYAYDTLGRPLSSTNAAGHTSSVTYDTSGRVATYTDEAGKTTTLGYDTVGQLIARTNPETETTGFEYDTAGRLKTEITPTGKRTGYTYDDAGRLVTVTDPLGNTTTYSYDAAGQLTAVTDANGNTTSYTYDTAGNRLTERDPLGNTTRNTYDQAGRRLTKVTPNGKTWTYAYDRASRLTSITAPNGKATRYSYDAVGRQTSITNGADETTSFAYDPVGNLLSETDPRSKTVTYTYDAAGQRIERTDPLGNDTLFGYDPVGNLTSESDALDNTLLYTYDPAGRRTSVTDAGGRTSSYGYDNVGRVTAVTAPGSVTTSYVYDDDGNLTGVTDPNLHTTTKTYDGAGRLLSETTPGGQQTSFAYDKVGQLIRRVSPNGTATPKPDDGVTSYSYDAAGRLTGIQYSEWDTYSIHALDQQVSSVRAIPNVAFEYDANGNRKAMFDAYGKTTYTYDDLDRLTRVYRNGWGAIAYTYDAANRITSRDYAGAKTNYSYDPAGRLTALVDQGKTTSYSYDDEGNLLGRTLPNGTAETRSYDDAGRLTRIRTTRGASVLNDIQYTLDPDGNPLRRTDLTATEVYEYDPRLQLTRVCYATACSPASDNIAYTYDPVGNRLTETRSSGLARGVTVNSYDIDDRLTSSLHPNGTTSYGYDPNGNLIQKGNVKYGYDPADRLVAAQGPNPIEEYHYDGDGLRIGQSLYGSGAATVKLRRTLWDTATAVPTLAAELTDLGTPLRRYTHSNHGLQSVSDPLGAHYYHQDAIGSVTNVTNTNGDNEWSYTYEPFGAERTAVAGTPNPTTNQLRYAGEYLEPISGLYHLRARDYDPTTGRFTRRDPAPRAPELGAQSSYVYAENRPTRLTDPEGRTAIYKCPAGFVLTSGLTCATPGTAPPFWLLPTPGKAKPKPALGFTCGPAPVPVIGPINSSLALRCVPMAGTTTAEKPTEKTKEKTGEDRKCPPRCPPPPPDDDCGGLEWAIGPYSLLPTFPGCQRHHIIQDAAVNGPPAPGNYSKSKATAIILEKSDHQRATNAQNRAPWGGTLGAEFDVAELALDAAAVHPLIANVAITAAKDHFNIQLGWRMSQPTKVPLTRRGFWNP